MSSPNPPFYDPRELRGEASPRYVHVRAQRDDSVSVQLKASLSDGAGVTSSGGELAAHHFSSLSVKHPVETGSA